MKRLFLIIFCVGLLTSLHGQPLSREAMQLSTFMGPPLTVGDNNNAGKQIAFNKLLPINVELDTMPRFQIGAISDQTVWHEGDITVGFYVLTDTLRATLVQLSYEIDFPPQGKITFDEQTGRFKYFPNKFDVRDFTVTFTAQSGNKIITQDVKFTLMAAVPPEFAAFGLEPVKPVPASTDDYTIISETKRSNVLFNNSTRTVSNFSISGKELVFDNSINNKLRHLSGRKDIEELNIFAERVIIRDALLFYQTNVTIYAKELIFEDNKPGVIASINTSPEMWSTRTDGTGAAGANAGNITLYIKEYKQTKPAFRFILNGGKGQDCNSNGTPGKGGNGGKLTSTVDVNAFSDKTHGSGGMKYNSTAIIGGGANGSVGTFTLDNRVFVWQHPNFISAIVKHAKDAYLNLHSGFTNDIFKEYTQHIANYKASGEWAALPDDQKMELENATVEMQAIMYRIGQNLDYFGNPVGWVPMLSFEINKMAFEQEIEKAIRVMYLSYWLKNIDATNAERIAATQEAITMVEGELSDNKAALNAFVMLIPELQAESTVLQEQIDNLIVKIERKRAQLEEQAKSNVKKRNRLNKAAGVLSTVAKLAPVVCSVIPGVGTAVGMAIGAAASIGANALSQATNASDTYGYENAISSMFDTSSDFLKSGFSNITGALNQIDISSIKSTQSTVTSAYNTISATTKPLIESIQNLHNVFSKSSAPSDQVRAELNKLMAESKEFQQLIADANVLTGKKEELLQKLAVTFNNITTTSVEVEKGIVAIDGLRADVFAGNSKRDLRAMQYLDDMERRAKERLLKYHYYVAKSYEYRLLKPYPGELNLTQMFDRFKEIAKTPNKIVLTSQDFQNLKPVYEEQLSTVTAAILDEYNTNRPEMTTPIRFTLTSADLEALNDGRDMILNIFERGMVPPNHENVRIVNFKVYDIKVHLEGDQNPSFANFELLLEHSGLSRLRKNGEIYYFNHINSQTQNPITWGTTYDAKHGITNQHAPSFASSSLLYSLLPAANKGDIMIYSRPGAWSDIRITKNNVTSGNTKMVIDELTFELQYDFTQRPTLNRNLDVYARDIDQHEISLMPYIEVSRADKNGRSNGRPLMYRTYNRDTDVTLTAPAEYGRYQFVNWTDRYGVVVSTRLTANAKMTNDVALTANYKYMGAVLQIADSVFVSHEAGTIGVEVTNAGSEEMDWSAKSNDSWIRIAAGSEEGIDDGVIQLEFDENPASEPRTGSITVTSIEADDTKIVFVKQGGVLTCAHRYEWNETTAPTCTTAGEKTEKCALCETWGTRTQAIPALGHAYTSAVTAAACETEGYTTYTCSRGDHQYTADIVAALGHNYVWQPNPENANEEIFVCTRCGEIKGKREMLCKHIFDAWENTLNPTCTIAGVKTEKCSLCGTLGITTQSIPALGHNYTSAATAPTCETEGYTTYTCSRGDHAYFADTVATIEHDYVWTVIIPATCTTNGGEIGVCKFNATHILVRQIPALGHNYTSTVTASTCETAGYTTYTCSQCGHEYVINTIADIGHTYTSAVTAATCETEGYTTYTCSRCDHTYSADTVAALEHDYVWTEIIPVTCTTNGAEIGVCKYNATHSLVRQIPASGHNYEWTTNPENPNEEIEVCSICGEKSGETRPVTTVETWRAASPQVYPNPVDNILYIETTGTVEVIVTDARGSFMCRTIIVDNGSIATNDWKRGVYFVTLKTETGNIVHKVVKK
ncbi:MAG: T9SS type A sorting domain-containing protein [Bacteroidetes bacterium]|nr:T9SS type A sorting domain-containing protein [Bacteroidota bacterium]